MHFIRKITQHVPVCLIVDLVAKLERTGASIRTYNGYITVGVVSPQQYREASILLR